MKRDLDRRVFIQTISFAALGAASTTLIDPFVKTENIATAASNEQTLERWLLDTGGHKIDSDVRSFVEQVLSDGKGVIDE
jgi:hypothetical protein